MVLTANKTKLHKLATHYISDLHPVRKMLFSKAPRSRSYFLECIGHKIYLSVSLGGAFLIYNNQTVAHPTIAELRELGMTEEQ